MPIDASAQADQAARSALGSAEIGLPMTIPGVDLTAAAQVAIVAGARKRAVLGRQLLTKREDL